MALDAIVEVVARAIGEFIADVVLVGIFYWPGWLFLRILTFGRYPPPQSQPHNREFVGAFGLSAILVALLMNIPGGGV